MQGLFWFGIIPRMAHIDRDTLHVKRGSEPFSINLSADYPYGNCEQPREDAAQGFNYDEAFLDHGVRQNEVKPELLKNHFALERIAID